MQRETYRYSADDVIIEKDRPGEAELERLERFADLLDSRFSILGFRFGLDSLIGLIPGIGDFIMGAVSVFTIIEAARIGAPLSVLVRMGINVFIDAIVGSIPLAGDAFDALFKANRRNVRMLRRALEKKWAKG